MVNLLTVSDQNAVFPHSFIIAFNFQGARRQFYIKYQASYYIVVYL